MSKKSSRSRDAKPEVPTRNGPWLSKRTGLIIIAAASLGLAGYVFWQLLPSEGMIGALLWGLGAGASIWAIFGFSYLFNVQLRGRN